ncbi:MAG: RICIN domain-containing protein [Oligoflexales bacterium]|nr:RICIN domain-containing protein [Oligoflexales bacterium]
MISSLGRISGRGLLLGLFLECADSGKCLDVSDRNKSNGAALHQWDCLHTDNQQFKFVQNDNYYQIETFSPGKCINIKDWKRNDGARLQQWECSGGVNQRFLAIPDLPDPLPKPQVIIFENVIGHKNLEKLKTTLKRWDWDFEVIGQGMKYEGFGTKFVEYEKHLKKLEKQKIVVLIDSRDIFANGSPEQFIGDYLRLSYWNGKHRIVMSTEKACCVRPMELHKPGDFVQDGSRKARAVEVGNGNFSDEWTSAMKSLKKREGYDGNKLQFNNLNSGMITGYVEDLLKMFEYLQTEVQEDDQALATEYMLKFPDRILLDYNNLLFTNAHAWGDFSGLGGCFFTWLKKANRFENKESLTRPFFIQTPAKYWTCYDHLYKLLK